VTPSRTWQSGGATWAISSNEAVNTPTLGAELVANGTFDTDVAGWSDVSTGGGSIAWVNDGNPAGAMDLTSLGGSDRGIGEQSFTVVIGSWYEVDCETEASTISRVGTSSKSGNILGMVNIVGAKVGVFRAHTATTVYNSYENNLVDTHWVDNISIKVLTLNTLFSSVETSTNDVVAQVELDTVVTDTQAGMVLNLDDKDTPANFVIAYHDGTNARLEKCVAGVYTTVITAVAAYAAGANLVVVKDGTSYALYYNNLQVGATSTISDAGIISNTLHGMFSTYSGNQLDNFQCFPRGTNGEFWSLEEFTRNAGHD
jgi:hypothetical protein